LPLELNRTDKKPVPLKAGLKKGRFASIFWAMFAEQDALQPRRRWLSATVVLVALNILAYALQKTVLLKVLNPEYVELSLWGIVHGYFWQLVSYQFMHASLTHLLLNCWGLFVFGRAVEWAVGKSRFLMVYFLSGIFGGLLQVMACFLWPHYFSPWMGTVGASAGLFGIMACFTMLFPEQQLIMLLFFVIPLKLRARSLLALLLVLTGLGISYPRTFLGGNVAHFAHLGGMLTGLFFTRFFFLRNVHLPEPVGDPS